MLITASTADFKQSLRELLRGSSKACVNFYYTENGVLRLQCNNGIIVEKLIPASCVDSFVDHDITVYVDRMFELIDNNVKVIVISIQEDILSIMQDRFMLSMTAQPEYRVDLNDAAQGGNVFDMQEFKEVVLGAKSLDEVARGLKVELSKLSIVDGSAYTIYSNTALIQGCTLPDISFSGNIARLVVNVLGSVSRGCVSRVEEQRMYWNAKELTVLASLANPPMKQVEALGRLVESLKPVCKVGLTAQSEVLESVGKVYKSTTVDLGICSNGFKVFVNDINTKVSLGSSEDALVTIKLSTAQLSAIQKTFSGCNDIEILKGVNILCMRSQSYRKTLILAGMLF